ncbi:MAG: anti-sigma factor family protein [bacterium]
MKEERDRCDYLITGYIDGELNEKDRMEVEKLLQESPELLQRYEAECKLKELVTERLQIAKAPAHLRRRIERQIARGGDLPTFWQLIQSLFEYRPVATSFALAVLAFSILLPTFGVMTSSGDAGRSTSAGLSVHSAQLRGEIICLDCDLFLKYHGVPVRHQVIHRPGLRAEDGAVWTILQDGTGKEIQYNRELLKRKATLFGVVFENPRYISVNKYKLL